MNFLVSHKKKFKSRGEKEMMRWTFDNVDGKIFKILFSTAYCLQNTGVWRRIHFANPK